MQALVGKTRHTLASRTLDPKAQFLVSRWKLWILVKLGERLNIWGTRDGEGAHRSLNTTSARGENNRCWCQNMHPAAEMRYIFAPDVYQG